MLRAFFFVLLQWIFYFLVAIKNNTTNIVPNFFLQLSNPIFLWKIGQKKAEIKIQNVDFSTNQQANRLTETTIQLSMVSFWQLFFTFTKIGTFTIGGGYAMLPLIEREVVDRRRWIAKEEFVDMVVASQTAPGILAMNISILVGNRLRGKLGAVVAALGSIVPSFVIILGIALFLQNFSENPIAIKMFRAVRPAVVALIAVPIFNMARTAKIGWHTVCIPILSALLIWKFSISPALVILVAGIGGVVVRLLAQHPPKKQ